MMMEYLATHMWQVWTALCVLLLVAELGSGSLYLLCFAIGAAFAAVGALFGGIAVQLACFVVLSAVSVYTVRPFAQRYLHKDENAKPSNTDALIGRTATVSESIEAGGYGRVQLDGDDWKAEAPSGKSYAKGEKVRVVGRESVILQVE